MLNWLRPLWLMFFNPARGMGEARDRAPLAPAAVLALAAQAAYLFATQWMYLRSNFALSAAIALTSILLQSAGIVLLLALVFVPAGTLAANLFERRGSLGVVLRQEFAAFASAIFYAWAAANLIALPLAWLASVSGVAEAVGQSWLGVIQEQQQQLPAGSLGRVDAQLLTPFIVFQSLLLMLILALFGLWSVVAVRQVFRLSVVRSVAVALVAGVAMFIGMQVLPFVSGFLASPFLLVLAFLLLRGYVGEFTRSQRARASFKQNLEAATLNPADASAHYNLGLIHAQRSELNEARERFERAVTIDAEEVDAHYQLGRIARAQDRLADAIKHFEQVVTRDESHAQHEIWREIGATYVAAGQHEDASDALGRFLAHRTSDPEGLYLKGRALAGLGRRGEALELMRACIEAVKTAPAYKYRTEKRWLNEAQQFLRSHV